MEKSHSKKRKNDIFLQSKKKIGLPSLFIPPEALSVPTSDLLQCDDLTRLPYLYDDTVLDCITARYEDDLIYTWAGPVLIAVNPFRIISSLYNTSRIEQILYNSKEGKDNQLPHVFTIAGLSHRRLLSQISSVNQAILVSGESGAGKTESARYLLNYLTHAEQDVESSEAQYVQKRIIASNPILEAFGNASTLRNHNSSRFGKLIRLQYQANVLKGALTDTYLLEKTRVTNQPPNERNFHIFHQVLAGLRHGLLPSLEPVAASYNSFQIIPEDVDSKQMDDLEIFKETIAALDQMGIGKDHQLELFKIVIAIMHLGNLSFEYEDKKEAYVLGNDKTSEESVMIASNLLGLPHKDLIEVLTVKCISVVVRDTKTNYHKPCERREQCEERRDSFMQLLYAWLFSHLVATINEITASTSSLWCSYLGILDVYGFETFEENSLEQLCINYANERLQHEFTRRYLASEQRILIEEGFIDFPHFLTDNSKCVVALDSPISVFSILNEECQLKRALNERSACERVCNALQSTGFIANPPSPLKKSGFVVKHYAGPVSYSSNGILHKNKDEVPNEIFELLSNSESSFVNQLVLCHEEKEAKQQADAPDTPGRRVRKITTLSKFKSSLDSLMKILTNCDLHYVRCIKPNLAGIAGHPDKVFLMSQLQAQGILETVKISQAGYPVRMLYSDFSKRYSFGLKSCETYSDKEKAFVFTLGIFGDGGTGAPAVEKCRYGKTRIFLSESSLQMLEQLREDHRNAAATCIQKNYRSILCRKRYLVIIKKVKMAQLQIRTWLARKRFCSLRKSVVVLQKNVRMWLQRRNFKRILISAVTIQKYIRGWHCRDRFKKRLQQIHVPLRSSSRLSISSAGYGSLVQSSLTDHSISDAETLCISDDIKNFYSNLELRARICETEESGVETDTESLSGEGLKAGRIPKTKKTRFSSSAVTDLSDTDFSDDIARTSTLPKSYNGSLSLSHRHDPRSDLHRFIPSKLHESPKSNMASSTFRLKREHHSSRTAKSSARTMQSKVCPTDLEKLRVATLRQLQDVKGIMQTPELKEPLQIHLPLYDLFVQFKSGILSYRQMPKVPIKFHTRRTCLPFSTHLPHLEKPRGLMDALR